MDPRALALIDVLVLTDGVAGHDRSSDGVVAALARHHDVRPSWLGIREIRPRSRRIARFSAALMPPDRWIADRVALAPERVATAWRESAVDAFPEHADIVVSTGPATAAANIAIARRYRAKNIYCGFPKWPVRGFHVIVSPIPSGSAAVLEAPRPSNIDATALPAPRPLKETGPRTLALLFGGESKHYAYTHSDMTRLAASLRAILERETDWTLDVYDSRRTATGLFDAFLDALAPLGPRLTAHRFAAGGVASNADAYAADLVMVTADSLSMVTESISAARPTLVIRAENYVGPARDRLEIDTLISRRLVAATDFAALDHDVLIATPCPPRVSQPEALSRLLAERGL
ncbi:mitochondrial fission ELM1 family protein [Acuticoccus sp. M5D2P5]|uniref:ELM1/GtrOC1 family putative glycosyltransferase n=1 Tax=Acuticoccus kalidii TaxID=2910977 RepID=UPI001F1AF2A5|nr:ELM1/GtrOC1 family putative glycosyltransferase [Acuticoccus kalidii]MCF3935114.1 mitochondrial fission ELM1 family protein [Acuticoccus kalidii]